VRLLLDTRALLWWLMASPRLSDKARQAIAEPRNQIHVSMATAWEIAIKRSIGRLRVAEDITADLAADAFELLPIELAHIAALERLPHHHRDPFDRMLVAQAMVERMRLVSGDANVARYGVAMVW
jgi:PIN domain nuclease of toxin-antitoxin system